MRLAMMAPAQRDGKLIAHLTAERGTLGETEVMGIRGMMIGPLPPATIGVPYSQTLTASGGTPLYVWSVVSGVPPNGIALSPSAGVLSGTPTAAGSFTFAVGVSDSTTPTPLTATKTLSLTVISGGPLAITSPLPPATTGLAV
jgi:hypothetical protein